MKLNKSHMSWLVLLFISTLWVGIGSSAAYIGYREVTLDSITTIDSFIIAAGCCVLAPILLFILLKNKGKFDSIPYPFGLIVFILGCVVSALLACLMIAF